MRPRNAALRSLALLALLLLGSYGWSQEEFAFRSGLHRTYVSGIERGTRNPTVIVLEQLAVALEAPPGQLLNS